MPRAVRNLNDSLVVSVSLPVADHITPHFNILLLLLLRLALPTHSVAVSLQRGACYHLPRDR